ncbi:GumC family protein [Lysobacter xanthus]
MSVNEAVPHVPEADSFQIRASLEAIVQSLRLHRWLVLACMVLTTSLVIAYMAIWPPIFEAEVLVSADAGDDPQRNAFYQGWNIFRKDTLIDEATLMTAPPVLKEVIKRMDLRYDEVYHPFTSYAVHLWGESWLGRAYRSVKYTIFPPKVSPYTLSAQELEYAKVLKDLKESVSVQQVGEASIGLLMVKGSTQRVSEIANTIAQVYLEQRRARFVGEAEEAYQSLQQETDKALEQLRKSEADIKQFYADNGMLLLFEKERSQIGQLLELDNQVTDLEARVAASQNEMSVLNRELSSEGVQLGANRVYKDNANKDRLVRLEIQLADANQLYQPNSPEVQDIEQQIAIAKAGIAGTGAGQPVMRNMLSISEAYEVVRRKKLELDAKLQGDLAALRVKRMEYAKLQAVLNSLPRQTQVNRELERRQLKYESTYRSLNEKLTMAEVSMATAKSAPSSMRVIDPASPPEKPRWPNSKLLVLVGMLSGLLMGAVVALLLDLLLPRVNRHRLLAQTGDYRLFAVVGNDTAFLSRIFPQPGKAYR